MSKMAQIEIDISSTYLHLRVGFGLILLQTRPETFILITGVGGCGVNAAGKVPTAFHFILASDAVPIVKKNFQ